MIPRRPAPSFGFLLTAIIACAAIVYVAGNATVGLWDRDEPRYAQTSRQMLQSGDWVVPRFLGDVRTAKPPLIYWCQAAAMRCFGDTAFAARLPSAIAIIGTLCVLAGALPRYLGRTRALWTIFILATSGMTIVSAKMSLTDATLLLWITLAQWCLFLILRGRGTWRVWIALGIAIGLAGLTKGPVVLGTLGTTLLALAVLHRLRFRVNDGKKPRPRFEFPKALVAFATIALIAAPWLLLIHQREPSFLPRIIGHDVIARTTSGLEGHTAPPGYYLLTIWMTYFPWSLFLPAALVYGWKHRRDALTGFALASVVGPWVMFEIFRTKLPHYLLPIFPWLALLTARGLLFEAKKLRRGRAGNSREYRALIWVIAGWGLIVTLLAAAPLALCIAKPQEIGGIFIAATIALFGLEMARATFVSVRAGQLRYAAGAMGIGTLLIILTMYGLWLPRVQPVRVSQKVGRALIANGATTPGDVIMIDYKEPSLAFAQGGTIREESNNHYLAITNPELWPRWIVITRSAWDGLPIYARERLEIINSINGWWYPKGRSVDVLIVRKI